MTSGTDLATLFRTPVTLQGLHVRLEPLKHEHAAALWAAARERIDDIWTYLGGANKPASADDYRVLIEEALAAQVKGTELPFAVVNLASQKHIGTTRFLDMSLEHRHVEIGWTWYAPDHWRTAVNTECKYLLLSYAFEVLGCIRVQLRTDERNERSRRAIERIGGVLEGIIRKDRITKDGWQRSSAQYSLLAEEWPANKARLEEMLRR